MECTFFSIIIPTYNSGKTLSACLDSILDQSFQNFEIILIDGCSTDDTISIIKKYAALSDSPIKWLSEKDKGIYDAMNKGVQLAKGEWLYFLGSDDKLHDTYVFEKVVFLNKDNYNVVYGNAQIVGDTSWAKNGDLYDGKFDLLKLLQRNICHQAMFFNIRCFNKSEVIFNTEYTLCADWDFNFRCWATKSFLFVNLIIADFYGGGETTKTNIDEAFTSDFDKNLLKYFSTINKFDFSIVKQFVNKK